MVKKKMWASLQRDARLLNEPENKRVSFLIGRFLNRDLNWLKFNDSVLEEAADPSVPLLERLDFCGIFSSNLDEFFMVRMALISRLARRYKRFNFPDGLNARRLLELIREHVLRQKARQAETLDNVLAGLSEKGVTVKYRFESDTSWDEIIRKNLPEIEFSIRRSDESLPPLDESGIYVFVRFLREIAILKMKGRSKRLMQLPSQKGEHRFVLMDRWLAARAHEFFPNRKVVESFCFKLLRDADLRYQSEDDDDDLEEQVVKAVQRRTRARIVRLEVDSSSYSEGAIYLSSKLGLDSSAIYRFDLPLDLRTLGRIKALVPNEELRYPSVQPRMPELFRENPDIFNLITQRDFLLHHPYDSFDAVIKFIRQAATDADVTEIYHMLYRTSRVSPVMEALREAAKRGKKVTVYVEIKARFDEMNNVRWAADLRKAGVRVVRPFSGFKVHSKVTQVIRKEQGQPVSYLHLGTGNYNEETARQYTDLGLLTKDPVLGEECRMYFRMLTHADQPFDFKEMMVAPDNLKKRILGLIQGEINVQKHGGRVEVQSEPGVGATFKVTFPLRNNRTL